MTNRREFLLGAGATALALTATASAAVRSAWASDIAILRQAYMAMHPGLFRYLTPAQVDQGFAGLEAVWASSPSRQEAYLALSRFLSTIRCGHSYANFYNQSDVIVSALFSGKTRLPFHFRWLDGQMVITANGPQDLPRGTIVQSIDGEPASDVLSSLLPYTRADGTNEARRVAQLEVRGIDNYETFDIFYGLTRKRAGQPFRLVTDRGERTVEAIDLKQRQAQITAPGKNDGPQWELRYEAGDVARLIMPGWAVYNTKWDWKGWLDGVMAEIVSRQVKALIVDLRDNEGGLDCGDEILARCIDRPLQRTAYERRVRYRTAPKALDPYLDTWDPSFKDWGKDAVEIGNGFYKLIEEGGNSRAPIMPKGPRFRGKLVVLVGPTNSSATFQFASLVQSSRLGVLVGSPTGGNRRGINGGAFFFLRLPASGLEVDLPLIGTFPATPQPDAGVIPDVTARESVTDIRDGVDSVLRVALATARG